MSDCQLWKRKRLCMVIFSSSEGNGFFFPVEHLKLRCKEILQEVIMGYTTSVSWCWANDKYEFYLKDLSCLSIRMEKLRINCLIRLKNNFLSEELLFLIFISSVKTFTFTYLTIWHLRMLSYYPKILCSFVGGLLLLWRELTRSEFLALTSSSSSIQPKKDPHFLEWYYLFIKPFFLIVFTLWWCCYQTERDFFILQKTWTLAEVW